jgi:CBS domain-containing protein
MIANMAAYGLARRMRPVPIYEALLEQDGVQLHAKKPVQETFEGLPIGRIAITSGSHVTFTREQSAPELLDAVGRAGRQEVFPVLDAAQKLIGMITLEDLTILAAEPDIESLVRAADIMRSPVSLAIDSSMSRALDLMISSGLRELPVVDADGRVLGLLDEADITREFMRQPNAPIQHRRRAERQEARGGLPLLPRLPGFSTLPRRRPQRQREKYIATSVSSSLDDSSRRSSRCLPAPRSTINPPLPSP